MRKSNHRSIRTGLAFKVQALLLMLMAPLFAHATDVYYTTATADGELSVSANPAQPTFVSASDTEWGTAGEQTYYTAVGNVTLTDSVVIAGDVTLILLDGYTLTCSKGIIVEGSNSLTITSGGLSSTISGTGALVSQAKRNQNAGIGGSDGNSNGPITINGGTVTAYCATKSAAYGAGIGGGRAADAGPITINGGTVSACCHSVSGIGYGAGIGGGGAYRGNAAGAGGTISIRGGSVTAYASKSSNGYGAGIGGGGGFNATYLGGAGGVITITGGEVTAYSSNSSASYGAGIGGGRYADGGTITIGGTAKVTAASSGGTRTSEGAGIGSGGGVSESVNYTSTVCITGGEVDAYASQKGEADDAYGVAIGGGKFNQAGTVEISGGRVTAHNGIGRGYLGSTEVGSVKITGDDTFVEIYGLSGWAKYGCVSAGEATAAATDTEGGYEAYVYSGTSADDAVLKQAASVDLLQDVDLSAGTCTYTKILFSNATVTMTFDTDEGSAVDPQTYPKGDVSVKPATIPTRDGYAFYGWYADADCTEKYEFGNFLSVDVTVYARWMEKKTIYYLDKDREVKALSDYTIVTTDNAATVEQWSGPCVFVESAVIDTRPAVSGEAMLVLLDDTKIECNAGISVLSGNELTITTGGYSEDISSSGWLRAADGSSTSTTASYNAGIGGTKTEDCGTINIYGGEVTASGNFSSTVGAYGTSIGGGQSSGGGTINIYGGYVLCQSSYKSLSSAGIGAGPNYKGTNKGSVNIIGNTAIVQAYGKVAFNATTVTAQSDASEEDYAVIVEYGNSLKTPATYYGASNGEEQDLLAMDSTSLDGTVTTLSTGSYYYACVSFAKGVHQTITSADYATMYYSDYNLVVPSSVASAATYVVENTEAYDTSSDTLAASRIYQAGDTIPKGLAVVVRRNSAATGIDHFFYVSETCKEEADTIANNLYGFDEAGQTTVGPNGETEGYVFYKLANPSGKVGFYCGATDGAAFTMKRAHTAYLAITKAAAANIACFLLESSDEDAATLTGISEVPTSSHAASTDTLYTLDGLRVKATNHLPAGIYIKNGKKIMVK